MGKGYLQDLATLAVSTGRRGIDRKRWRTTRRPVLERDQYRCRKDELAAGAQGSPVKDPPRAAADRRNNTQRSSGRIAGHVPSFGPGSVYVSGSVPGPAPAGIRGRRPQLPGTESTPGPTRAHRRPPDGREFSRQPGTISRVRTVESARYGRQGCALLAAGSAAGCPN